MRRSLGGLVLALELAACSPSAAPSTGPGAPSPGSPAMGAAGPDPSVAVPYPFEPLPEPFPGGVTFAAVPAARYVPMFEQPEEPRPAFVFGTRNWSGRRAPLLVLDDRVDDAGIRWLQVQLPVRPNGRTAWIHEDDVQHLRAREQRIVVDLSRRTLRYFRGDELVTKLRVGIGGAATPSTTGTFFVWVRIRYDDPGGPYGIFALGLSGFSRVLRDWPGGGRLAIHGTDDPSDRGRQVSHGCIRVYNPELRLLRNVPLGTPVTIRE